MNWKPMKITQLGQKKVKLLNEKVKIRMWEIFFKHKSVKVKEKLNNMEGVMDILKLSKFSFFEIRYWEIWITK